MTVDRHKIWRIVRNNHAAFQAVAPEGYEAIVEIYVFGRPDAIVPSEVQTTRDREFAWSFIHATGGHASDQTADPADRVTLVPEQHIERVEISYRRKTTSAPVGFDYKIVEEPDERGLRSSKPRDSAPAKRGRAGALARSTLGAEPGTPVTAASLDRA